MKKLFLLILMLALIPAVHAAVVYEYNWTDSTAPVDDLRGSKDLSLSVGGYGQTTDHPVYNNSAFNGSTHSQDFTSDLMTYTYNMDSLTEYSISFWMKVDGNTGEDFFWHTGEDGSCGTQRMSIDATGALRQFHACGAQITAPVTTGRWIHFVSTLKEGGTCYLYKNASQVSSASCEADFGNPSSTHYIGGSAGSAQFDGKIDSWQFFDHQLTQAQINNLYNCNNHTACDVPATFSITQINFTSDGGAVCSFPARCAETFDRTPTFVLTSSSNGTCRISGSDQGYAAMSTDCTPGIGSTGRSHSCTFPSNKALNSQIFYFACNSSAGAQTAPNPATRKANLTEMVELKGSVFDDTPTLFNGLFVGLWSQLTNAMISTTTTHGTGNYSFNVTKEANYTTFSYSSNITLGGAIAPHIEVT